MTSTFMPGDITTVNALIIKYLLLKGWGPALSFAVQNEKKPELIDCYRILFSKTIGEPTDLVVEFHLIKIPSQIEHQSKGMQGGIIVLQGKIPAVPDGK